MSQTEKPVFYQQTTNKTFKMIFEITDKYFASNQLTAANFKNYLTVKLDGTSINNIRDISSVNIHFTVGQKMHVGSKQLGGFDNIVL